MFKAPEVLQFEEGKIGPASDVYTLGVTLFALSFNRMPFNSVLEILNGSLNIGLLPSKQAPTEEFKDLLTRMLDPCPETRI